MKPLPVLLRVCFGLFVLLPTRHLTAEPPTFKQVSAVGTFNNWNLGDGACVMKPAGQRFELVRSWDCGTHDFKFVFDGSWAKHWGAGPGGTLTQPGENIKLTIPQTGTYAVWLDPKAGKWGFEKRAPDKPIARIVVRGTDARAKLVELDGRASEGRSGHEIQKYTWSTDSKIGKADFKLLEKSGSRAMLTVDQPGDYAVQLAIDDGDLTAATTETLHLGSDNSEPMGPVGGTGFRFAPKSANLPGISVVERVDLVGDFNGWSQGANRMSASVGGDGVYTARADLRNGLHHYKFVVNGAIWLADPAANPKLADKNGNSGVRIGPDPAALGPVKPNDIIAKGLFHDPSRNEYFAPITDDTAFVTLQTLADDVQSVEIELLSKSSNDVDHKPCFPLARYSGNDGFDYWRAQVSANPGLWKGGYRFNITDGSAKMNLFADSATSNGPGKQTFQGNFDMRFKTPDWAKHAVWYQIFPERFRNGDTSNDPPRTVPWSHSWFKPYKGPSTGGGKVEEKGKFFEFIYDRRYGGDLQGVREQLGYLRELGVTAIYFNPIFQAESLHKYDASDYRHIDDFFGVKESLKKIKGETEDPKTWQWSETDKVFLDFLNEAHRQGFKVVLDGVFNHVGRDFWAFRDVLKHGEKSKYTGWFDIVSYKPFHYKAWDKDDGALPRLKHDDKLGLAEPVREHLFAVTRRWMDPNGDGDPSDGIDGWRLDVAGDINVHFWADWRKLVKHINPNAYIVAELWQESKVWLDGRSFDAVMNYPFAVRSQRFLVNDKKAITPTQFAQQLKEMLDWYPPQVNHVLQNLYDSHDTDRLASMFLNPDLEYDQANRPQDNGPKYNTGRPTSDCYQKVPLAATWQMMFLGAPMIYYGDEVGMYGADDPSDRKPMLWADLPANDDPDERIEPGLLDHYKRMIAIRNTYPALRLGSFEPVMMDDERGVFAFVRRLNDEIVLVVMNNSDKDRRVHMASPFPDGGRVVRLDDPKMAEMVQPAKDDLKTRATIRPLDVKPRSLRSDKGVLWGVGLKARSAGVYVRVADGK